MDEPLVRLEVAGGPAQDEHVRADRSHRSGRARTRFRRDPVEHSNPPSHTLRRARVFADGRRYARGVAYDEELADRIRELVAGERGVTEKRMFGGLAFLVHGNMAVAASGQGGLLVRVDPDDTERLVSRDHVTRMVMRGRSMDGWLRVDDPGVRTKRQLEGWVKRGMTFARSLPPKKR